MRRPASALLLLLLAPAAGCGGEDGTSAADGSAVPEEARYGGSGVMAGLGDIPTLNPLASADYVANQVLRFVLSAPLVRYDAELEARPHVARSWEFAPDSSEVEIRLRRDVRWHDGEPVTAADVAFTFRRAKDPEVGFPNRGYFARWDEVEVVDEYTVRFRLRPYPGLWYGWTQVTLLPEHLFGDVPPSEIATHPYGTSRPVGYGPFRFVGRVPGDRWVFEANPEFPSDLGGRPYLDRLVYRVIPEETTRMAELQRGEVDIVLMAHPSQVAGVREDPGLRLLSVPYPSYTFIAWNSRRPFFRDSEVRRALTLAIDRRELVETVREGLGEPASGPLGPWHWAHDSLRTPPRHSPDSARALLEAAGWRDRDGDGVREKDGVPFRFELTTNQSRLRRDIAVMVQARLARVGVDAVPRTREYASLVSEITSPERRFDAVILSWNQDLYLDERDQWLCDRIEGEFQFASYCNPEVDAVLDSLPGVTDRETRGRLLRRYDDLIRRDQPYSFLYWETRADAIREGLHGVELDVRGELVSVARWWIHPDSR